MLFKCLALENPSFRVLNYEPGIVDTDQLKEAVRLCPEYKGININILNVSFISNLKKGEIFSYCG